MTFSYLLFDFLNFIQGRYFAPVLIRIGYKFTLSKVNNFWHSVV